MKTKSKQGEELQKCVLKSHHRQLEDRGGAHKCMHAAREREDADR